MCALHIVGARRPSPPEARESLEEFRRRYNEIRPRGALSTLALGPGTAIQTRRLT